MRWGKWFLDGKSIIHIDSKLRAVPDDLEDPVSVARFTSANAAALSVDDVLHLLIAANELMWQAFNFQGIGDWLGEDGTQQGIARVAPEPKRKRASR